MFTIVCDSMTYLLRMNQILTKKSVQERKSDRRENLRDYYKGNRDKWKGKMKESM